MHDQLKPRRRLLAWGRSLFALAVVAVLLVMGIANIAMRAQWNQVEDSVLWQARPEGVTATEVSAESPAADAGITRGDVLRAVNGLPVERPADLTAIERRSAAGARLSYTIDRLGARQVFDVTLAPYPRSNPMYFVLAAVGLFTLLVGASVRLRRPEDQATLHFFWLCVAFFCVFTF
jgi:membrane-associated protease RseP (regulator of RpoE activity)